MNINKKKSKSTSSFDNAFITQTGERVGDVKQETTNLELLMADSGQTSQATLLLKKKKEMREVDHALDNMKSQYKQRMDACEDRRIQFELKQGKMREQVSKFEKFIQENDAKRSRAENKVKSERKLYDEKLREIALLAEKYGRLEIEQNKLMQSLISNGQYKSFLERIVENDMGYEEIGDILNRHNTLTEANNDLMRHSAELEFELDEFRKRLQSIKTEKQNQLLVNTSVVQDCQTELEKMVQNIKIQDEEGLKVDDKKKDISRELSQTIQAIRNLFGRCFNTMRVKPSFGPHKDSATMMELLDFELDTIGMRIFDLVQIYNEFKAFSSDGTSGVHLNSMGGSSELKDNSALSTPSVTR